jgi:hypothetical protein
MNDRQRLEAIVSVVCKYLPPDGTPINEAMSEIIGLVDPLPPQRTWVGLTNKEVFEICYSNYYRDSQLVKMVEAKLKEKNT